MDLFILQVSPKAFRTNGFNDRPTFLKNKNLNIFFIRLKGESTKQKEVNSRMELDRTLSNSK